MGCIASKHTVTITPALDTSGSLRDQGGVSTSSRLSRSKRDDFYNKRSGNGSGESEDSRKDSSNETESLSFRLSSLHRYIEGEQVAAGWPGWLTAVAGEAIRGWIPLKGDTFEKLEKIGQGTYSSVFRARELESGKIVAMKKVRFDNLDPESVRFMAREIQILRRLDHPNIVKLEGLVTSRMSNSIYLVFEYMEHDFAGLLSSPDIKFSEAQVKCYMHQLLSGLEHCHSRGIMHRDIKGSNLLVNNEGILKIADFGLANFFSPGQRQPLTSRVVTLWYRPPELLLGSTNYVASVDLWSVGCVFAELLIGKPILQGRTEVEQLHKIFKLCGSPPEEYWKKSKLPHATIFKPQHPYHSSLRQLCKDLPPTAADLIETFLSVEPYKRGTAKSALKSTYFTTKPYACEPSSLPKYPPNKEIDAKGREEAQRKGLISKGHGSGAVRRPARTYSKPEPNRLRLTTHVEEPRINIHNAENNNKKVHKDSKTRLLVDLQPVPEINQLIIPPPQDSSRVKCTSPGQVPFSGPLQVPSSSGFAWAKHRPEDNKSMRSSTRYSIKDHTVETFANPNVPRTRNTVDPHEHSDSQATSRESGPYRTKRRPFFRQWGQTGRPDSFDASDMHYTRDFSRGGYMKDGVSAHKSTVNQDYYQDDGADKVEFSGPLLTQSLKVDELLQKNEKHIRQMMRRSWFQREQKHGK